MYLLRNYMNEKINNAIEASYKPSIDLHIYWLNPLLHKCEKRL